MFLLNIGKETKTTIPTDNNICTSFPLSVILQKKAQNIRKKTKTTPVLPNWRSTTWHSTTCAACACNVPLKGQRSQIAMCPVANRIGLGARLVPWSGSNNTSSSTLLRSGPTPLTLAVSPPVSWRTFWWAPTVALWMVYIKHWRSKL